MEVLMSGILSKICSVDTFLLCSPYLANKGHLFFLVRERREKSVERRTSREREKLEKGEREEIVKRKEKRGGRKLGREREGKPEVRGRRRSVKKKRRKEERERTYHGESRERRRRLPPAITDHHHRHCSSLAWGHSLLEPPDLSPETEFRRSRTHSEQSTPTSSSSSHGYHHGNVGDLDHHHQPQSSTHTSPAPPVVAAIIVRASDLHRPAHRDDCVMGEDDVHEKRHIAAVTGAPI